MFLGHFATALISKKIDNRPSLGTMFLAAQWLDLLWPVLLLTGTETVEIEPGNSASTPLNFVSYPISHSLLLVVFWSFGFGFIYYLLNKNKKGAILIALLVLSHWVLDLIVHIPDLPLTPFSNYKVGFGLWNQKYLTLVFEILFFVLGVYMYSKSTVAKNKVGQYSFWSLVIFLLVIHIMNAFGPPPPAVELIAIMGLAQWLLVAWGYWVDSNRTPVATTLKQA